MICSTCGATNKAGRKFCAQCASSLAVACPLCGASNEPEDRFCGECAAPLTQGARPAAVHAGVSTAVAERRLVSVLFADLVGFTPFAEERDAEDVRDILTRYFELASDVITRYGGTVEKFIGDAVMAVWGSPVAREDDAERAVRAGLELVDAVKSLGHDAARALEKAKLDVFGELLTAQWDLKLRRSPTRVHHQVDDWIRAGISSGAAGGKLVGAGDGGFLLFYAEGKTGLRETMAAAGLDEVRFGVDYLGTSVLVEE